MTDAHGSWRRRNRWALLALIVLLPAAAGVFTGLPLLDKATYGVQPRGEVPFGQARTLDGMKFEVIETVNSLATDDTGFSLIGVLLEVSPGASNPSDYICSATLTDGAPGGTGDAWELLDSFVAEDLGWEYLDDTESYCLLDVDTTTHGLADADTGTRRFELIFLAPAGSYEHAKLQVTISKNRPNDQLLTEESVVELSSLNFGLDPSKK